MTPLCFQVNVIRETMSLLFHKTRRNGNRKQSESLYVFAEKKYIYYCVLFVQSVHNFGLHWYIYLWRCTQLSLFPWPIIDKNIFKDPNRLPLPPIHQLLEIWIYLSVCYFMEKVKYSKSIQNFFFVGTVCYAMKWFSIPLHYNRIWCTFW